MNILVGKTGFFKFTWKKYKIVYNVIQGEKKWN